MTFIDIRSIYRHSTLDTTYYFSLSIYIGYLSSLWGFMFSVCLSTFILAGGALAIPAKSLVVWWGGCGIAIFIVLRFRVFALGSFSATVHRISYSFQFDILCISTISRFFSSCSHKESKYRVEMTLQLRSFSRRQS